MMKQVEALSAASFVKDKDVILQKLAYICRDSTDGADDLDDLDEAFTQALDEQFETLKPHLEKYQEQSHLLDVHLEEIITPVMQAVKAIVHKADQSCPSPSLAGPSWADTNLYPDQSEEPAPAEPFGLQQLWSGWAAYRLHVLFKVVYLLCKIRGYKTVVKMMPHEAMDLEPALRLLQRQDAKDFRTWETRYALLIWLSILALIPFDLTSVDSSANRGLIRAFIATTQRFLRDPGPAREAAAFCVAKLLTRPDLESVYLGEFLEWSLSRLCVEGGVDAFEVAGILHAVANVYKTGHRKQLLQHHDRGRDLFHHLCAQGAKQKLSAQERKLMIKLTHRFGLSFLPPKVISWRYNRGQRKLLHPSQLPNTAAHKGEQGAEVDEEEEEEVEEADAWAFEEIEGVIEHLLVGLRDADTVVRWSAAKGLGRVTARLRRELADDVVAFVVQLLDPCEPHAAWHGGCLALAELARRGLLLPCRLPDVVPLLVQALVYDVRKGQASVGAHVRDAACYVCWAFARAYAPNVMKPFVPQLAKTMLVTAVFDREINCRRAAAAAFQENVGRQGHENFPHGIEILTRADYFNLGNRTRAYTEVAPFIAGFPEYQQALVDHLAQHKIFHWDLAIRQLSAKALGLMAKVAPAYVCGDVLRGLLPQTLSAQMFVRHGATLALAEIVATMGINLPQHLGTPEEATEALKQLRNVVMKVEKARLYRGRGGEWMRAACCALIQSICDAGQPLSARTQLRLLESLHESMKHPKEEVKRAAIDALSSLSHVYLMSDGDEIDENDEKKRNEHRKELIKRTAETYAAGIMQDPNPAARRAFALALGALPPHLLAANDAVIEAVIDSLTAAALLQEDADEDMKDAETRRNAVAAVGNLLKKVALVDAMPDLGRPNVGVTADQFGKLFDVLLAATNDYDVDNRGDVGSWVRMEALSALCSVIDAIRNYPCDVTDRIEIQGTPYLLLRKTSQTAWLRNQYTKSLLCLPAAELRSVQTAEPPPAAQAGLITNLLSEERLKATVCALVKQLGEKMVVVRDRAGTLLTKLLQDIDCPDSGLPLSLPELPQLRSCLLPDPSTPVINWRSEPATYPLIASLLSLPTYRRSALEGLVVSIGDLTASTSKYAANALVQWRSKAAHDDVAEVVSTLMKVLVDARKCDRVTVPALKTVNLAVAHGMLDRDALGQAVAATREELRGTRNVHKLMQAAALFGTAIVEAGEALEVRKAAVAAAIMLLGHRYPKVRQEMYSRFYMAVLGVGEGLLPEETGGEHEDQEGKSDPRHEEEVTVQVQHDRSRQERREEKLEKLLEVLSGTAWSLVDTAEAREKRDELYELLSLPKPQKPDGARTGKKPREKPVQDGAQADNYASLIKSIEMGY